MLHKAKLNSLLDAKHACLPKPSRVHDTHRTSTSRHGTTRAPLSNFLYFIWNGSIIVMYFLSLNGLAMKKPP